MELSAGSGRPLRGHFRNYGVRHPVSLARKRIGRQTDPAMCLPRIQTLPVHFFTSSPHRSELDQALLCHSCLGKLRGRLRPARAETAAIYVGRRSSFAPVAQAIDEFTHFRNNNRQPLFHRFSADLEGIAQARKIDTLFTLQISEQAIDVLPKPILIPGGECEHTGTGFLPVAGAPGFSYSSMTTHAFTPPAPNEL